VSDEPATAAHATTSPETPPFRGRQGCDVCGKPIPAPEGGRGSSAALRARRCSAACRLQHERRRKALRRGPASSARLARIERWAGLILAEAWAEKRERARGA